MDFRRAQSKQYGTKCYLLSAKISDSTKCERLQKRYFSDGFSWVGEDSNAFWGFWRGFQSIPLISEMMFSRFHDVGADGLHDFGEDLHWKFPESFWRVSGVCLRVSERCRRVPRVPL